MYIGYIRVSTAEQNLGRQINQIDNWLKDNSIENDDFELFTEKESGGDIVGRPAFQKAFKYLRKGDTLVVTSLDRLSRNYDDIKSIVSDIQKKKAKILVLDSAFLNFDTGNETMDKAMFDMFLSLLGFVAQNERDKIRERQAQGIALAKEKGAYIGRPKLYSADSKDPQKRAIYKQIIKQLGEGVSISGIADEFGITRQTVYRIRNEMEGDTK